MKKIGHKMVDTRTGEIIQQWVGNWHNCPGVPSTIVLPNGDRVEGAGPGAIFSADKRLLRIEPVMAWPTVENVKAECERRIIAVLPLWRQIKLSQRVAKNPTSKVDRERAETAFDWIDRMVAVSDELEKMDPIPDTFDRDETWPEAPPRDKMW